MRLPGADVGLAVLLLHFGTVSQVRQRVVTGAEVPPEESKESQRSDAWKEVSGAAVVGEPLVTRATL